MIVRDYLYLDSQKLQDYSAGIDGGTVASLREVDRQLASQDGSNNTPILNEPNSSESTISSEATIERTLSVSNRHAFNAFLETVGSGITKFEELDSIEYHSVAKNALVEVTRSFERSPLTELLDTISGLGNLLQRMGGENVDQEQVRQVLGFLAAMTKNSTESDRVYPMLSEADGTDVRVLFIARHPSVLVDIDDLEGEMTMVGKVTKLIPAGKSVDLIDEIKLIPRNLRRMKSNGGGGTLKDQIEHLLTQMPETMGGPVTEDSLRLTGPAMVVSPLAAFN